MTRLVPAEVVPPETAPDDPRIGRILGSHLGSGDVPDAVLLSFPSDAGGLCSDLWIEAAYQAGRSPAVSSADIVELNPGVDRDGQTARLAAVMVWWLLRARSERR